MAPRLDGPASCPYTDGMTASSQPSHANPASRTEGATPPFAVEVFFDGECPLCTREITLLRKMDRRGVIRFTDITASSFDASETPWTAEELMASIRGRRGDGTPIEGVEVFRQLYAAVGLRPLVALTRLPGVRQGLDFAYEKFAKNRLKLTGRCTPESCAAPGVG
jgi:predicted DCC family thiol-disulfide oxidoreductase YuxK